MCSKNGKDTGQDYDVGGFVFLQSSKCVHDRLRYSLCSGSVSRGILCVRHLRQGE